MFRELVFRALALPENSRDFDAVKHIQQLQARVALLEDENRNLTYLLRDFQTGVVHLS